ncbi:MAG: DUF1501 domain-containing protein [Herpetosiphon sp.]
MAPTRRQFLVGCSTAIAAMATSSPRRFIFAGDAQAATAPNDILVVVFLRGGCDGLSLVSPYDDSIYQAARGALALPASGASAALTIDPQNASFHSSIGLHPAAGGLHELYQSKQLAIVHACGLDDQTRSHFEAMDFMERGTPGQRTTSTGWITRHLQNSAGGILPSLATDAALPESLLGADSAVAMNDPQRFGLTTAPAYTAAGSPHTVQDTLAQMYQTDSSITGRRGRRTLEVMQAIQGKPQPYVTPVVYPKGPFGGSLREVAQIVKYDLGLQVATVDLGGWDTHEAQGNDGQGYFATQAQTLSDGLHALYTDLANYQNRLTVVVMSEFGRRLAANPSGGTDHGHGNMMLVLGGNVNGGKLYGTWPGLQDLDHRLDLKITTDYRTVLGEILLRRLQNPYLGNVFPGLTSFQALGMMRGANIVPQLQGGHAVFMPVLTN